jgi:hypothetical protein
MPQRPWAIDDLIIYDDENLESRLTDGIGLPRAAVQFSKRHGRWPAATAISRQGTYKSLTAFLKHSTAAERRTARTALFQYLNPELGQTQRLTVVDEVLPGVEQDGVLLAVGPWDIYCDSAGVWHVRDILRPDDLEADLSGGWLPGSDGGLQIAEAVTVLNINPSFEVNHTDGWNFAQDGAGGSRSHDTSIAWVGNASCKITSGDAETKIYTSSAFSIPDGGHITVIARVRCGADPTGNKMLSFLWDATNVATRDSQYSTLELEWECIRLHWENDTGLAADITPFFQSQFKDSETEVWIDGVNVTAKAYPVPYCDGSLAPGHSWSGTAHNSTSSRTAATCVCDISTPVDKGAISLWWIPVEGYDTEYSYQILFDCRNGGVLPNTLVGYYEAAADKFILQDGTSTIVTTAQSFSAYDEIHIVFTWSATTGLMKIFINGDEEASGTYVAPGEVSDLYIGQGNDNLWQVNGEIDDVLLLDSFDSAQIARWYSYGRGALNARRLDVRCEAALPWAPGGITTDRGIVATLAVHKDVRWQQRDGDVAFWRIYDDEEVLTVDVDTEDDVYPEFRFTPRTAKTSGFTYRQWQAVKWPVERSATDYPVMLGAFNLTGKAQGDGDDIRVYVDGEEVDRWLGGTLVSAIKVWFNLDFEADISLTLAEAIAATGDIDYIQFNEDISALPVESIIYIDSEAFCYTDKNNRTKKVSGISRATRGTSEAAHTASTAAYWLQHDVFIYYGDASLSAPTVDNDYKPAFDLDNSTNSSWIYTEFGEDDGLRVAQWQRIVTNETPSWYDADHGGNADPWEELGILCNYAVGVSHKGGRYMLHCPCGISNINFSNGEKYAKTNTTGWNAKVQSSIDNSSWTNEYTQYRKSCYELSIGGSAFQRCSSFSSCTRDCFAERVCSLNRLRWFRTRCRS